MFNDIEDMAEFKWSIIVVLLIYSIHITQAEHELSCFIPCHLGQIETSHKLMEPH